MATASGALAGVSYKIESTRGTTPAGAFIQGRFTDRAAPQAEVGELTSNEVTENRQETTIRSGLRSVSGSLGFELSRIAQDDFFELLTNDSWAALDGTNEDIVGTATASSGVITFTPTDAAAAVDALPGMVAVVKAGDNADLGIALQVTAADATTITLESENTTITDGAAITSLTFGQRLFTTKDAIRTMSMNRRFVDVTRYQAFRGVSVNECTISARPESLVTGTFGLLGLAADAMNQTEVGGTPTANPGAATVAFSPFSGCVFAGGERLAFVTGFDLSVTNNRSAEAVLCQPGPADIFEGVVNVSGSMTLIFEDETFYNAFINETELMGSIRLEDPGGEWMAFGMSRLRFGQPSVEIPNSGPIKLTLPFRALESNTTSTGGTKHSLSIQRSKATV